MTTLSCGCKWVETYNTATMLRGSVRVHSCDVHASDPAERYPLVRDLAGT